MFEKTQYKLQICFVLQIKEVSPHIPQVERWLCFMNALTKFSKKRNV